MEEPSLKRRLAAVLYADVAGYSRLTGEDEEGTHRRLAGGLDILTAAVVRHAGRVVHFAGDAVLAEFSSAVQALACAADAQAGLAEVNRTLPAERRLEFRIGLNLGDVISDRDDIYGEGVNIAARLEALAEPGGICVSEAFRDAVGNKLPYDYEFLGARSVKNIASPVRAYRVLLEGAHGSQRVLRFGRVRLRRAAIALGLTVLVTGIVGISWWAIRENLQGDQGTAGMSPPALTRQLSKLPSIAVLPFRNLGSEAGQAYFIDGITQDISTDLSRFPELMVIAASSSSAYPPDSASTGQIGHELGVRYLLEGSAERGPEKLRLNVQLVDATNGVQLWTERFERDLRSIAQTRDEIVQRVVATLAVRIEREELERVRSKDATDLAAYDYVLRGRERLARGTREDNIEARELLRRAIEIEPDAASAYLALGEVHRQAFRYGWVETPGQMLDETEALARTALRLDDTNAGGHQLLGFVYLARQRLALAENEYRRALELNPNDAESHAGYGLTLLYLGGRTQEAVAALQTARRLDPHMSPSDSVRSRAWILALALYLQGHYGDAIRVLEQHLEWFPNHAGMHALLAAAYARAGHPDKASRAARDVRRLDPFFDKARFGTGLSSEVDREHLYAGLVEAGLE